MKSWSSPKTEDEHHKVRLVTLGVNSVFVILDCPTLGSLKHLWSDYLSGHLNKVAERYLVTDEMRKNLNLQTIRLTTTIAVENYFNSKKVLTELYRGPVAQLVEQRFALREVVSSTLAGPTLRVLK